jgi:hypothetical protein
MNKPFFAHGGMPEAIGPARSEQPFSDLLACRFNCRDRRLGEPPGNQSLRGDPPPCLTGAEVKK